MKIIPQQEYVTEADIKIEGLESSRLVALVDMDGTLCECSGAIMSGLAQLRGPLEDPAEERLSEAPAHIVARRRLIMSVPGFWRDLQPLRFGFDVIGALDEYDFKSYILTKGPRENSVGWMEKFEWCRKHVPDLPIVITEEKAIVHGAVLVEDWPPYIAQWLHSCPTGLVIVPAQPWNLDVERSFPAQAIRYDGSNLNTIRQRLALIARQRYGE